MVTGIKCPSGHTSVWKKGTTPTRSGAKVRYICTTCGRTFYKPKPTKTSRKSK